MGEGERERERERESERERERERAQETRIRIQYDRSGIYSKHGSVYVPVHVNLQLFS